MLENVAMFLLEMVELQSETQNGQFQPRVTLVTAMPKPEVFRHEIYSECSVMIEE